ncbi:MAG TPA: hypothetical protein VNQ73_18975 [Ilumatobacter sp.]|nr:hypothetical protein [Ilumatobacter sp.]
MTTPDNTLDPDSPPAPESGAAPSRHPLPSRRVALVGGAAAAGAALATAVSRPAAAANGDPLRAGRVNVAAETTELRYDFPIGGTPRSHVLAVTDGVWLPQVPNSSNDEEVGTRSAILGWCGNDAVVGVTGVSNSGVRGSAGGRFHGESPTSYGLIASGRRGTLRLMPPRNGGTPTPPPDRADPHHAGEITIDDHNDIWVCVVSGSPGSWRKLSGPATAGSFHPITPVRVFDSRLVAVPNSGKLAADGDRLVGVGHGRNIQTGEVSATDAVPEGATAISFNVTVTGTTGPGYVFVGPGDATEVTGSTINYTADLTLANGGVVKLDGNRNVKLFCKVSATDVILDVTGYYR